MGGDGDQGGGAGVALVADLLEDLAAFGAIALVALFDGRQHQVAVAQALGLGVGDQQHIPGLAVDGFDPDLLVGLADDAKHLVGAGVEPLDQPGLPAVLAAGEFDQDAVAHAGGGAGLAALVGDQQGARRVGRGLDQTDIEFAVEVALDHIGDADRGQGADFGKTLAAALAEFAGLFELADHFAQGAALAALEAEMAGDVGFLGCSGFAEEGDQGGFVGKARRGSLGVLCHSVLLFADMFGGIDAGHAEGAGSLGEAPVKRRKSITVAETQGCVDRVWRPELEIEDADKPFGETDVLARERLGGPCPGLEAVEPFESGRGLGVRIHGHANASRDYGGDFG